ncbi:ATP-binding protein [Asticcacaulis excentricus]|uniref:ATPase, AAA+ superfamily protein n=1 Tax=Asticcacaulis excentricus (strain ATCC 15261 / DSM 4724 / KCTC 12464 / NCIMB 9791 / VKM B-1370 / CB 48) TaxID=573065 RepID=E8RVL9_ASTEC|nr:ATP-binding protein [Asticcacaulis excentricus]ADU15188.1 ATPase, AAA+ superfamily protein [Asticcacaulis excentricus CB 48]
MMDNDLFPRHMTSMLTEALQSARVVNVVGPRQAGKTTLVRELYGRGRFLTLDHEATLTAFENDPAGQLEALMSEGATPLVIDEAQRSKRLALAIKAHVDRHRRMGQVLLTGSSNIFSSAEVMDSLAGRAQTLVLHPLSAAEIYREAPTALLDWAQHSADIASLPDLPNFTRTEAIDLLTKGGYPEIRPLGERARQRRYRAYIDSIVDRDVADILKVRKTDALRRTIDQLAVRTANELNMQELCSNVGIQRQTADQYCDVLERLSLVKRLAAWASGEVRRDIRHPKIHMLDTGIATALRNLGADSFAPDAHPAALGGLLETWVFSELIKNLPYADSEWRPWHWRGDAGREVDILLETGRELVAFEIKASTTITPADLKNLKWFISEGPGKSWKTTGIIIYLGSQPLSLGDRLFAVPLSVFWAKNWRKSRGI